VSELLDLAVRVAGTAQAVEQLEVVFSRDRSTKVRSYGGEVESFTSAETFGVGIRVVRDHRVGFASAGTFDEAVVAEVLTEARDNATYAEPVDTVPMRRAV
jgi:predicted Zn-dependent protease